MWDSSEMVGLNISLRFIFKPSYSKHCINTNVGRKPWVPKNLRTPFEDGFK